MKPPPLPLSIVSLCLACIILLPSCKSTTPASKPHLSSWEKRDVEGLYLELDNPDRVGQYRFYPGGSVALTIGEKNGFVMGPSMSWYIKNGSLRIYADSKKDFEEIKLIEKHPDHIIVQFGDNAPEKYFKNPQGKN
jgi:hypothetical protein